MFRCIAKQREIIDRKKISAHLNNIASGDHLSSIGQRAEALAILKEAVQRGLSVVRHRFESKMASGTDVVRANSFLMDQVIRIIYDFANEHRFVSSTEKENQLSLSAVGGYGRGELSPFSDLDLLFLLPLKESEHCEQMVTYILYMLWDLGLKVGHAARTVTECIQHARTDTTVCTAMMEARWLWGEQNLYNRFKTSFQREIIRESCVEFVETKLTERDERHARLGDTRYVLEPNVKEGKGGLRDLHTLFWIARYLYGVSNIGQLVNVGVLTSDIATRFTRAQNFLWTVRCHLHYLAGRAEDQLTFDVQQIIGHRMGYTDRVCAHGVERFMKHYFLSTKEVGNLTRVLCAVLEERYKRKPKLAKIATTVVSQYNVGECPVENRRLTLTQRTITDDPICLIRLFYTAHVYGLDIHPDALRLITENRTIIKKLRDDPEANSFFIKVLMSVRNPITVLRLMNESGVLGHFIPAFGRVVAQIQYDMYHVYTTDEHIIRAVGILHDIENGRLTTELPLSTLLVKQIHSRRALYIAVLLHDIAKGRNGDHSELGARVVGKLGVRFGLTDEEIDTSSWLVLNHLSMSRTAFKRDIEDPKTVEDFAKTVQSPERLRLLLLLTCCDIRAVGPATWNAWKGALLRDLYYRTEETISGLSSITSHYRQVKKAKNALSAALHRWPQPLIAQYLELGRSAYWLSFSTEVHVRHAHLVRRALESRNRLTLEFYWDLDRASIEIVICTNDYSGLFAQVAGAISLAGESIINAKIATLANGVALDTFWIQESQKTMEDGERSLRLEKIAGTIKDVINGDIQLEREFSSRKSHGTTTTRTRISKVPPRCIIDNTASKSHTVIEVNGHDRLGLLFEITATLTALGLHIASARIATYGERVVDVFYVKDSSSRKILHKSKIHNIRNHILEILEKGSCPSLQLQEEIKQALER